MNEATHTTIQLIRDSLGEAQSRFAKPTKAPQIRNLGRGAPVNEYLARGSQSAMCSATVLRALSPRRRARPGRHLHRVEVRLRFERKLRGKFIGVRGNLSPGTGGRAAPCRPQRVAEFQHQGVDRWLEGCFDDITSNP